MILFLFSNFTALAVTLKQAQTKEFKDYQLQVLSNAKVMANELMALGYTLATGKNYIIIITNPTPCFLSQQSGSESQ